MSTNRKAELKRQYKETKRVGGVYQIKNIRNQKVFVGSTLNLKMMNGRLFQLKTGSHQNKQLQQEWNEYGEEAFIFEVLEELKEKTEGYFDPADELSKMHEKWLVKLQPYGEAGYHRLAQ
ncbi:hypothetical protein C2W64_00676 [Brevibacillus laterosporus]|nr:GIY-YIG nuclease family protein [Brevibacillus laterosporus]RAP27857.1 hypothetical protein C2W64_00676 [Brevibacillus laterosporus]